jgi:inhibitor of KinA sporulation pathway (predicted exonuclease)
MAKDLSKILVIDLEATCWDGKPPVGQANEIIEIGACLLNTKTGAREKHGVLVKPEHSEISEFCTKLTTITPEMIEEEGVAFGAGIKFLQDFKPGKITWASWGDYDRRQLERECKSKGIKYPFGVTHLNVKNLFALHHKLPREIGMDAALSQLGTPLTGTHHRGIDDAYNIAGILAGLLGVKDEVQG